VPALLLSSRQECERSARPLISDASRPVKRVQASLIAGRDGTERRQRMRVRGPRVSLAAAAAAVGGRLRGLLDALGVRNTQLLMVCISIACDASFEWGASGFVQRVRAAQSLYNNTPWWQLVLIRS